MTVTKFNIHTFKLDDYKTDLFKSEIEKGNEIFKFVEQVLNPDTFILSKTLSKYFKTKYSDKSLTLKLTPEVRKIIESTTANCVLKNRLLQEKPKTEYFGKDNFNFITVNLDKGVKDSTDQIFTGLSYKNFESFGKLMRNFFLMSLITYKADGFRLLHKYIRANSRTTFSRDIFSSINHDLRYSQVSTDESFDPFKTWVNSFLEKLDIKDNLKDIANNFGVNDNFIKKVSDELVSRNIRIGYFSNFRETFDLYLFKYDYLYEMIYYYFSNFDVYCKAVSAFTIPQNLSINNIINKIFEYDNYVKARLNVLSYTKTISKTNPVSGFVSEINTRIPFDEKNKELVESLTKDVNALSVFQQEISNKLSMELLRHKKNNTFHIEEVKGDDILYYYNVTNYENSGYAQSVYKYGSPFLKSIQNLNGFGHIKSKDGELFNSCMRGPQQQPNIRWYAKNEQSGLLILTNEDKSIIRGRAVLWYDNGKTYVDRIFTNGQEAQLEFAKYINDSDIIPIYQYSNMSAAKSSQYSSWQKNNFGFDPKNINMFNSYNPYLDTMRRFKFVYNDKTKRFEPYSEYSNPKTGSLYYDPCSHRILKQNSLDCKCSICGNMSYDSNLVNIEINGSQSTVCRHHIQTNPEIFGENQVLMGSYNKIKNLDSKVSNDFGFTTVNIITKFDGNDYNRAVVEKKIIVGHKAVNDFMNSKDTYYFTSNVPTSDTVYPVVERNHCEYGYLREDDKKLFYDPCHYYTFYNIDALKEYFKKNPNRAMQFATYIKSDLMAITRTFIDRSPSSHKNKDIISIAPGKNTNLIYNLSNATSSYRMSETSPKKMYELLTKNNEYKSYTIKGGDKLEDINGRSIFYFKEQNVEIKDDTNSMKILHQISNTYAYKYRYSSMPSGEFFDNVYDITYLNEDIFDILVKLDWMSTYKAKSYKNSYTIYKWILENFGDYVTNLSFVDKEEEKEVAEKKVESVEPVAEEILEAAVEHINRARNIRYVGGIWGMLHGNMERTQINWNG